MKISVHMKADGIPDKIDECLAKMHYDHTENHLRSDGEGGWYLETEIATHYPIVPADVISRLEKIDSVIDVKIK